MQAYKTYKWIVSDPLSVGLILECMASGMRLADIDESFDGAFPHEALPEVLAVAAETRRLISRGGLTVCRSTAALKRRPLQRFVRQRPRHYFFPFATTTLPTFRLLHRRSP